MRVIEENMKQTIRLLILVLGVLTAGFDAFSHSAIYACGHIRRHREVAIDNLRNSGYTTAILFNVNVEEDGTLTTDFNWSTQTAAEAGGIICRNGEYVFDSCQPFYRDDVLAIITPTTSVERLEICIGGWTNGSYGNIKALVEKEGTGPETVLYRNFKALKEALPWVEAVNNDQEQDYDVGSVVAFHKMLYELGYKTTISPYTYQTFWQQMVAALNAEQGIVDRVYLQTYGGGAFNDPEKWQVFGDIPMYVGFDCEANSNRAEMDAQMTKWAELPGVVGGFLWNYNSEERNHNEWAANINRIFNDLEPENPAATFYGSPGFSGYQVSLGEGSYNQSVLAKQGIAAADISSFRLSEGYRLTLYKTSDLSGPSSVWTESAESIDSDWDNAACSLKIDKAEAAIHTVEPGYADLEVFILNDEIVISGISVSESVSVFNLNGVKIEERNVSHSPEFRLSLSPYPKGIYLVRVSNRVFKVMKK